MCVFVSVCLCVCVCVCFVLLCVCVYMCLVEDNGSYFRCAVNCTHDSMSFAQTAMDGFIDTLPKSRTDAPNSYTEVSYTGVKIKTVVP